MTRLDRALALLVASLLVWLGSAVLSPSHASIPATPGGTPYTEYSFHTVTGWHLTLNAAGSAYASHYGHTLQSCTAGNPGSCVFTINGNNNSITVATRQTTPTYTCPGNSTLSGTVCNCNSGYTQSGNICVADQEAIDAACKALADGLNFVGAPLVHYGSAGLSACFGGYVMSGTGSASGGGQTELYGPFKCAGANASSCSVVPKPSDITATCDKGSYPGTVNGVQVCVPPTSSVEAPKTTTTTPPAPGGTAPEIPGAPPGTTTEEKQTECQGTSCTTTTSYKDASGASTGTRTDVVPKSTYCAENPKAPGCGSLEGSSFSGSCGGFTFKGDAIQGAIAKEIHTQNCLMNATTDESALYDAAKLRTGDQTLDLPGNETIAISSGQIDQSNAIVGGTCIGDRTINLNLGGTSTSIVLPFSDVCPLLDYFRLVLIALGFFIAYRIIGGR